MKKIIIGIIAILVVVMGYFVVKNYTDNKTKENNKVSNVKVKDSSVLVVYFSATNNTKNLANKIADNLNASIFEIVPKDEYTSDDLDYTDDNSRVVKEHESENLRDIELVTTKVDNWSNYDTIIIAYPIWWGISAWPVNSFVKANDFTNKTVIPVCTSASSGIGESDKLLKEDTKGGNWVEGTRFSSSVSDSEIKKWTDSLK